MMNEVIVEIDEDQHKQYTPECEQTRMLNIAQALGQPVIFIRYNPDAYRDARGVLQTTPKKQRLETLRDTIAQAMQAPPVQEKPIDVRYLFYDPPRAATARDAPTQSLLSLGLDQVHNDASE